MKKLLIILFFLSIKTFAQSDSIVWETGNEKYVINYQVQQSFDTSHWIDLGKIQPLKKNTNWYSFSLPAINYYYRIISNMVSNSFATSPDLLTAPLPVELSNISITGRVLRFTSNNENNLQSYIIYESMDGINFVETIKVPSKGNSNYQIQLK